MLESPMDAALKSTPSKIALLNEQSCMVAFVKSQLLKEASTKEQEVNVLSIKEVFVKLNPERSIFWNSDNVHVFSRKVFRNEE